MPTIYLGGKPRVFNPGKSPQQMLEEQRAYFDGVNKARGEMMKRINQRRQEMQQQVREQQIQADPPSVRSVRPQPEKGTIRLGNYYEPTGGAKLVGTLNVSALKRLAEKGRSTKMPKVTSVRSPGHSKEAVSTTGKTATTLNTKRLQRALESRGKVAALEAKVKDLEGKKQKAAAMRAKMELEKARKKAEKGEKFIKKYEEQAKLKKRLEGKVTDKPVYFYNDKGEIFDTQGNKVSKGRIEKGADLKKIEEKGKTKPVYTYTEKGVKKVGEVPKDAKVYKEPKESVPKALEKESTASLLGIHARVQKGIKGFKEDEHGIPLSPEEIPPEVQKQIEEYEFYNQELTKILQKRRKEAIAGQPGTAAPVNDPIGIR